MIKTLTGQDMTEDLVGKIIKESYPRLSCVDAPEQLVVTSQTTKTDTPKLCPGILPMYEYHSLEKPTPRYKI